MKESNEERDVLALQSVELRASKHIYKGQLEKFHDLKSKVGVTQEHLTQLADLIVSKTDKNEELKEKVKKLEEELEVIKFQVSAVLNDAMHLLYVYYCMDNGESLLSFTMLAIILHVHCYVHNCRAP